MKLPAKIPNRVNRSQRAFTLAEMIVAIGVSSIFILMLTSLLSQTLAISTSVQKQLYASAIAELAVENVKNVPYNVLLPYKDGGVQTLNLYTGNTITNVPRFPPLQFDLAQIDTVFGSVDPTTGQINSSNQWTQTSGNFFRGSVEETISDAKGLTGLDSLKVDIVVNYDLNGRVSKRVSRSVLVFSNG